MLKGAQAVFLGGQSLKMRFSGTQPASLFWCTIFAWGSAIIAWGGTSSDLGGYRPKMTPMAPGLHFTSLQTPYDATIQESAPKNITP